MRFLGLKPCVRFVICLVHFIINSKTLLFWVCLSTHITMLDNGVGDWGEGGGVEGTGLESVAVM